MMVFCFVHELLVSRMNILYMNKENKHCCLIPFVILCNVHSYAIITLLLLSNYMYIIYVTIKLLLLITSALRDVQSVIIKVISIVGFH